MIHSTDFTSIDAFYRFAIAAEQIAATTKRLTKAAILGDYFTTLEDDDLRLAARYFAGSPFPQFDQRVLQIGGSALMNALLIVSEAESNTLQTELVKRGDLGEVAADVLSNTIAPTLRLSEVGEAFAALVEIRGNQRKVAGIVDLLKRATAIETKYLIKLMSGDLRIGLREGAVEDAIARLASEPVSKIQWVNMLTGDIGETAVRARHKQLDTARMQLFHPIKFMLASPVEEFEEITTRMPEGFAVEDKYDGIRAQVHIANANSESRSLHGTTIDNIRVALFSRTLDEITGTFPDLVDALATLDSELILDGEIVPFQGDRILPFQELQKRLGRKTLTDELLQSVPVAFVAYDILYCNGKVLIEEPYQVRRSILESLNLDTPRLRRAISKQFTDVTLLEQEFQAARDRGNEGLMVKYLQSTYRPGKRGKDWLKVKRAIATLDVVITAAEVGTGKRSRFLSDFTFAVRASETDPTLLNVGKAYSGLTDAEVQELSDWLKQHTIEEFAHGRVRTVEPQIVLEITFDRVQVSKRHKSGYALRFPRILRIRSDKPPEEIDTLETVRKLADQLEGNYSEATQFVDRTSIASET
ncbi:ATP-dependent DNA ligase [Leptolyngbya sp. NIES-3755]|nr:ATP-dependent DNA ligase [Leptolyngbya sp. NIES-3755]